MAYALFTLPLLLPAAIGGDANVSEGGDTRDTSTDRSIDSSAGSESAFLSSTGWHGPINVEYSDKDCPNVGCHGPWEGVAGPEVCEGICDSQKGCNAMNFNGGGCCLRACAKGKQITANASGGSCCSYYRVGPAPPPPPPCPGIEDKSKCLRPCLWNSSHCTMPPPSPPPPPPCYSHNTSAACMAPATNSSCTWNKWNVACTPAEQPLPSPPPPVLACSTFSSNVTCPVSHSRFWWEARCIWNSSGNGSCQDSPKFAPTNPHKPMVKLGVTDIGLAETTPVLWKGRLVRFESVHIEYGRPVGCVSEHGRCRDPAMVDFAGRPQPYFRVVDPVTHEVLSTSFGIGHVFGSAMVQPAVDSMNSSDTFWVWGSATPGSLEPSYSKISSFYSTNLQTWINGTAFEIKNSTAVGFGGICNNAVTRLDTPAGTPPAYVMAIESNGGPLVGKAYLMTTFAYLNSSDLSQGWTQFNPRTHHYTNREYSACPTIRHFSGWFYVAVLFSPCCGNAPGYQQVLVRSRDLRSWSGPALPDTPMAALNTSRPGFERAGNGTKYNPILCPLFDKHNDKQVGPRKWNYNTTLTNAQKHSIAAASDPSNSDMDWSDDGRGGVYISYGWSNQESFANMFLAAAEVRNATQQEWLESFFD